MIYLKASWGWEAVLSAGASSLALSNACHWKGDMVSWQMEKNKVVTVIYLLCTPGMFGAMCTTACTVGVAGILSWTGLSSMPAVGGTSWCGQRRLSGRDVTWVRLEWSGEDMLESGRWVLKAEGQVVRKCTCPLRSTCIHANVQGSLLWGESVLVEIDTNKRDLV